MEEATRCRPAAPMLPSSLFLTSRSKWMLLGGGTLVVAVTLLSGFWQNSYHPAEPHHIHLLTPTRDESSVLGFPPPLPLECQAFVTQPPKASATTQQQQQLHVSLVRSGPRSRRPMLQLHGHATFVPNLDDDPPLYNYTCFALKARYNCAFSPPHPTPLQNASSSSSSKRHDKIVGRLAHQWKLVLQQQQQSTTTTATNTNNTDRNSVCDLRHVVQHTLGGMPGVATFLWHNQQRHWTKTTATTTTTTTTTTMQSIRPSHPPSKIINILILGNSYLRQVWESMACQYASHITNGFFQNGGPGIDKAARQGQAQDAKVYPQDVGEMVPFFAPTSNHTTNPHTIPICHGALKQYQRFFHPNATLSSQRFSPQCNDNVAMVEFENRLRVYYVFQPACYDNFTALLVQSLQLDPSQVHHVVWNGGGTDKLESRTMATPGQPPTPHNNDTNENEPWTWSHYNLANAKHVHHLLESAGVPIASWEEEPTDAPPSSPPRTTITTTTTITDWKRVLPFVRQLQQRQGPNYYYFGADNPGMHHPPDAHPCMPGLPDDQVALLLLVLVYQLELDL